MNSEKRIVFAGFTIRFLLFIRNKKFGHSLI